MPDTNITAIRKSIEDECIAMKRGFAGYAITSKHAIITHRYDKLGEQFEKLAAIVGDEEAIKAVAEALERSL